MDNKDGKDSIIDCSFVPDSKIVTWDELTKDSPGRKKDWYAIKSWVVNTATLESPAEKEAEKVNSTDSTMNSTANWTVVSEKTFIEYDNGYVMILEAATPGASETPNTTPKPTPEAKDKKDDNSMIYILVGGAVVVVLAIVAIVCCMNKGKPKEEGEEEGGQELHLDNKKKQIKSKLIEQE